jgi:hypothetical protein
LSLMYESGHLRLRFCDVATTSGSLAFLVTVICEYDSP